MHLNVFNIFKCPNMRILRMSDPIRNYKGLPKLIMTAIVKAG